MGTLFVEANFKLDRTVDLKFWDKANNEDTNLILKDKDREELDRPEDSHDNEGPCKWEAEIYETY